VDKARPASSSKEDVRFGVADRAKNARLDHSASRSPAKGKQGGSGFSKCLHARWWNIPVLVWLVAFLVLIAGFVVYSIFFSHRQIVPYRLGHTFAISDDPFFGSAHALADPIPIEGNKITLLQNGEGIFPVLLEAIRGAKYTVNFEAFLFESGTVGDTFRDAFIERAKAGVQVRVILDGVGSGTKLKNSDVEMMRQGGCQVVYYHPTHSWRLDRINRRSHRRILVVDGRVGFTGGVGFSDHWQGNGEAPDHWRDIHAKIEGPLVGKLQGAFQQHWVGETKEALSGPGQFPALEKVGNLRAQMTASHSFSVAALSLKKKVAIAAAERRICITNAYCAPSDDQVNSLVEAVKRGVQVDLLLPGKHNDQPLTKAAGRHAYGKLLEGGVNIYEYVPSMIHSKTMVFDGLFSLIGTSNFDSRSAVINEELDVSVYDHDFGKQMEAVFDADLQKSKPYTLEEFKKRSAWERFSEAVAAPFHSQL